MNRHQGALALGLFLALAPCMARAELVEPAAPDGHIAQTLIIDGVKVSVDADVYGSDVEAVQAYRVEKQNPGGMDFFYKGEHADRLQSTAGYLDWGDATGFYPERLQMGELKGMSIQKGIQKLAPMLDKLGVTAISEPFDGIAVDLDRLDAATQRHMAYGVAPDETVVEDWTQADEHYRARLAIRYHSLPVMPWKEYTRDFTETPDAYLYTWIGRDGIEYLQVEFVPGEDEALGEPLAPMTAEEALARCAEQAKSRFDAWGYGEPIYAGVSNAHVNSICLGYVMLPDMEAGGSAESRLTGMYTRYIARPAWFFTIYLETTANQAVSLEQPEPHAEAMRAMKIVALDAATGEMLLDF